MKKEPYQKNDSGGGIIILLRIIDSYNWETAK